MRRRDLIKAVPAIGIAGLASDAVPAMAEGSCLRDLYHRWQASKDEYSSAFEGPNDDAVYEKMIALEKEAASFQPQTVEDFAFKVIFADDNGDMNANLCQDALVAMAYQIAGVPITSRINSNRGA